VRDRLHRSVNAYSYRRAISDAHRIVEIALERFGEPAAVGLSGGKDSVAMCHIVAQHCRPQIIWNDSGLELPESESIVRAVAAQLGLSVIVAKGRNALTTQLEWGMEKSKKKVKTIDEQCIVSPVREVLRDLGIRVEFVGLRAQESRRRKMVLAKHGAMYLSQRWSCGIAWPLREWKTADVFAYIEEHGLPLHPAYARTNWSDRDSIRVSWAWDPSRERIGDMEYLRRFYPQLFHRIKATLSGET
jgi:phosphoadenosine phosphosulfate reductase